MAHFLYSRTMVFGDETKSEITIGVTVIFKVTRTRNKYTWFPI